MSGSRVTTATEAAGRAGAAPWAGNPPQRRAARERLLEAASRCIARDGLAGAGIAAVAAESGVSRPTVYRYFADRDALVRAALRRAGRALTRRLSAHLEGFADPAERAVEAVLFVLREVPRDSVLREVWTSASVDASALRDFTSPVALEWSREALGSLLESAGWDDAEADEAIEVMLRFALSLLAAPEPRRSPGAVRAFLQRRMVPALGLA